MDKNTKAAKLPRPASEYIKRMYTDTVSPHAAGIKFAIEYYGIDNVMYGSDYPCWEPAEALRVYARAAGPLSPEPFIVSAAELASPPTGDTYVDSAGLPGPRALVSADHASAPSPVLGALAATAPAGGWSGLLLPLLLNVIALYVVRKYREQYE